MTVVSESAFFALSCWDFPAPLPVGAEAAEAPAPLALPAPLTAERALPLAAPESLLSFLPPIRTPFDVECTGPEAVTPADADAACCEPAFGLSAARSAPPVEPAGAEAAAPLDCEPLGFEPASGVVAAGLFCSASAGLLLSASLDAVRRVDPDDVRMILPGFSLLLTAHHSRLRRSPARRLPLWGPPLPRCPRQRRQLRLRQVPRLRGQNRGSLQ